MYFCMGFCTWYPQRPEEGIGSPETGVTGPVTTWVMEEKPVALK